MNLPNGKMLKSGIDLSSVDFYSLLAELKEKRFSGYLALTVSTGEGIEEGVEILDEGKPVASSYEYLKHRLTVEGDEAWKRFINASSAKTGVIDVIELSNEQVHLVLAFNEGAISVPSEADMAAKAVVFSPEYGRAVSEKQKKANREAILGNYGIGAANIAVGAEGSSADAGNLVDELERLFKKKEKA